MNERLNIGKCNIVKNLDIIESKIKVKQKWEKKKRRREDGKGENQILGSNCYCRFIKDYYISLLEVLRDG